MRVAIVGSTGLVGSLLAERLLDGGAQVHAIGRRGAGRDHLGRHEHVAPPELWPGIVVELRPEKAVSALGTTWKAAGSEAAFRAVDVDLVMEFAWAARAAGARHMVAVSAAGADAASRNFYLRTGGQAENGLTQIGFERLDILRPGLLRGPRGGERRLKERAAIV